MLAYEFGRDVSTGLSGDGFAVFHDPEPIANLVRMTCATFLTKTENKVGHGCHLKMMTIKVAKEMTVTGGDMQTREGLIDARERNKAVTENEK